MTTKVDCELIRANLTNIKNAVELYGAEIERLLRRIDRRE